MKHWYIIQTFSGFEQKVAETLKDIIKKKLLNDKIDEVQYNLDEFSRITDIKIDKANNALNDLEDSFNSQRRQNRRKFSDIEQTITQLQNQVKELHKPKDDDEKKKK